MKHAIRHFLTRAGELTYHPSAFVVLGAYVVGWLIFDRQSFDAHGIATVATWLMTLFIQRAEHRDTQAIHAKLDELLRVDEGARTELARIDDEEPEEIQARRDAEREDLERTSAPRPKRRPKRRPSGA